VTASALLAHARAAGFRFTLMPGQRVRVRPTPPDALLAQLHAERDAIADLLAFEAGTPSDPPNVIPATPRHQRVVRARPPSNILPNNSVDRQTIAERLAHQLDAENARTEGRDASTSTLPSTPPPQPDLLAAEAVFAPPTRRTSKQTQPRSNNSPPLQEPSAAEPPLAADHPGQMGAGLLPSWADARHEPTPGLACTACRGTRWWRRCNVVLGWSGWCCAYCHPPPTPFGVRWVQTSPSPRTETDA